MFSIRFVSSFVVLSLALLSLASSSSAQTLPVPFSICASGKLLFQIANVSANEWPPKKGTDLVVLFDGTVLENVTDGHYEISVTWETLPVYDEKGDITALLLNQSLPITNGTFCYLSKEVELGSDIPDGSYVVKVQAWDVNNSVFTCFEVKFKFADLLHSPELPTPTPVTPLPHPTPAEIHPHPLPAHAGPSHSVPDLLKLKLRRERRG